jgi:hypothetical protein
MSHARLWQTFAVIAAMMLAPAALHGQRSQDRLSTMGGLAKRRLAQRNAVSGLSGGCVNQPDCGEASFVAGQTQSETAIAVDSTGQHIVIGFNDFRGFRATAISLSGFIYSDDGGATFVDGGQLPTGPTRVVGGFVVPQVLGDPDVKYIGGCTFVYSSLATQAYGTNGLVGSLVVHRSTDCGHTWQGPFDVPPSINPGGTVDVNGDANDFADKDLADVDPDTGRYILCWSNFTLTAVEMSCAYSDSITAAVPTFSARRVVSATPADGQGMSVRFAGNGSPNAYVAWERFPGAITNNVGFARSTDNGVTWSAPVNLAANFITMDEVLGNDRVHTSPSLAVDKSAGPFRGNVYVVYSNNNSRDGADVAFQRSADGGITFSAPVLLNSRPGNDRAQWFPFVTADRNTGRVYVFYYDQGVDTSGDLTQVTYLYSDDGGGTWSRPAQLTDQPFKAGWGNDSSQPNLGDYNQAEAQLGALYAAYAATTPVGFAEGQPGTSLPTPDVFFKKVAAGAVSVPLQLGASTAVDSGGDGNIDPGEQVQLTIPLTNAVTNPLSATTLTGVAGTLSTTTPGVIVSQAVSAYPALLPGATAANATPYVLQISPAFAPGTPIQLTLSVATAQGPATLRLTRTTGTPVYTTLLSENFDSVSPGALPAGWTAVHGAGLNTVPWRTSNSFCGASNKLFHPNADDGPVGGTPSRWERLFSPSFAVPGNAEYVTIDFDVCYDTEDDPNFRIRAYDGLFLRITDLTPGRTLRSVLAEAFEQEFTTDSFNHYPKHLPRNGDPNYFEDMSAWAGSSNGIQHVHMKLPGMAGSTAQLRFEFTQDGLFTCADVRPGHTCGVAVDNVVVRSALSIAPSPVNLETRVSLARDTATSQIVATLTIVNTGTAPATNVQLTSVTLNGQPPLDALPAGGTIPPNGAAVIALRFASSGAPGTPAILRVAGSYTGGSFNGSFRVTLP